MRQELSLPFEAESAVAVAATAGSLPTLTAPEGAVMLGPALLVAGASTLLAAGGAAVAEPLPGGMPALPTLLLAMG